jgi:hypothetical protein
MSQKITVCLQIGNSDDKLTQKEWSEYYDKVDATIDFYTSVRIHFSGSSAPTAPWQNFCWVFEIDQDFYGDMLQEITDIRERFRQDAVAVLSGQVEFI